MTSNLGFEVQTNPKYRKDAYLFGEFQGRVVVSVSDESKANFESLIKEFDVPCEPIGKVNDGNFVIDDESFGKVSYCKDIYDNALASHL